MAWHFQVFPIEAPAYFATKEFKRYDWSVEVNPQKLKGDNEYDVIVEGSGIAGLTCGALLSKRGYKILVLEQRHQVGGYCSSFMRKNFVFNVGVENVSLTRLKSGASSVRLGFTPPVTSAGSGGLTAPPSHASH